MSATDNEGNEGKKKKRRATPGSKKQEKATASALKSHCEPRLEKKITSHCQHFAIGQLLDTFLDRLRGESGGAEEQKLRENKKRMTPWRTWAANHDVLRTVSSPPPHPRPQPHHHHQLWHFSDSVQLDVESIPRWPTSVGCRGLVGGGDAGTLALRSSATPIRCTH